MQTYEAVPGSPPAPISERHSIARTSSTLKRTISAGGYISPHESKFYTLQPHHELGQAYVPMAPISGNDFGLYITRMKSCLVEGEAENVSVSNEVNSLKMAQGNNNIVLQRSAIDSQATYV